MINDALNFLDEEITNYLKLQGEMEDGDPALVTVSQLTDQSGTVQFPSLGLVLTNIEEERIHKAQAPYTKTSDGVLRKVNPEIKLNLYVLIASHHSDFHSTGLIRLGYVIDFFQAKHVFTPQTSPNLPDGINKLVVEMITLTFEQQNHLWGTLGAKYMPSVLYKVRMLTVQASGKAPAETIREIQHRESGMPAT